MIIYFFYGTCNFYPSIICIVFDIFIFGKKSNNKSLIVGTNYHVTSKHKLFIGKVICSINITREQATEARMSDVETLKKQVINYLRTRETFRAYKASGYSKRYLAKHEQDILLHRAAKKAFNDLGLKKLPTVKALQAEYASLLAEKRSAYPAYREARAEMKKLLTYRANAEAILGMNANTGKRQKEHEQR